jgi:hypothetical protein
MNMKLARFSVGGVVRVGAVHGAGVVSITDRAPTVGADMISLIENWSDLHPVIERLPLVADFLLSEVVVEAPIGRPGIHRYIRRRRGHDEAQELVEGWRPRAG